MIICRCEGVYLSDVLKAIEDGASSVPGIKKRVRVGMGYCQGRVCQQVVRDILASKAKDGEKPPLQRAQNPVRPVLLRDLIKK
jgi:NAD(P)H-nitrite reductase large subunit